MFPLCTAAPTPCAVEHMCGDGSPRSVAQALEHEGKRDAAGGTLVVGPLRTARRVSCRTHILTKSHVHAPRERALIAPSQRLHTAHIRRASSAVPSVGGVVTATALVRRSRVAPRSVPCRSHSLTKPRDQLESVSSHRWLTSALHGSNRACVEMPLEGMPECCSGARARREPRRHWYGGLGWRPGACCAQERLRPRSRAPRGGRSLVQRSTHSNWSRGLVRLWLLHGTLLGAIRDLRTSGVAVPVVLERLSNTPACLPRTLDLSRARPM